MTAADVAPAALERLRAILALRADATQALDAAVRRDDVGTAETLARALEDISVQLRLAAEAIERDEEARVASRRALLAEPWDRARDLLVLLGEGSVELGQALSADGQRRIFCLDPSAPEVPPSAQDMPAVVNARALTELDGACWWLAWPHPAQLRLQVTGPGLPGPPERVVERLERTLRAVDQAGDEIETSSYLFLHCATKNLPRIAEVPSVEPLANVLAGRPAIVVSAGPSLDKNLHLLRELAGRAVVIGINQTVGALRKVGVKPDVVVALDPQDLSYQFEGVAAGEIGALCLGASVGGEAFDVPADHHVTFASSPMPEGWIYEAMGEHAGIQSGGSVATAAVQVALHLGCSPIILVGRDLALAGRRYYASDAADGGTELATSDGGKTFHLGAMTSKLQLAGEQDRERLRAKLEATKLEPVEVPGHDGAPVLTYPGFVFEMDILRAIVHRERARARFINATEGGAFLDGMEHRPLADVIAHDLGGDVDARATLARALGGVDLVARRRRLRESLGAMAADMRRANQLALRCERLCGKTKAARPRALLAASEELDALSRRHPILAVLTQRTVRDVQRRDGQGWDSLGQVIAAERALYASLRSVAGDLAARTARLAGDLDRTS